MTPRTLPVFLLAALAACSSSDGSGGDAAAPAVPANPLATDIGISEVAIFQGVKVPLMKDGARIDDRPTPVVLGRDALLRVYIKPADTWKPRQVIVRLEIQTDADKAPRAPMEVKGMLSVASTEEALESTANFALTGDAVGSGARYSVSIVEAAADTSIPGDSSAARWPAKDTQPLLEQRTNDSFKIVLVPFRYDADGSQRLPDTGPDTLEKFRARMHALYPTPKVDISVVDPVVYPAAVGPQNQGDWNKLLQTLLAFRQSSMAAPDVYYYGIIAPTASEGQFCGGGCYAGLTASKTSGPSVPEVRGSVGVGFPGEDTIGTLVHETGHAQGLKHAPCSQVGNIASVDPSYPYGTGEIGVWGYDLSSGALKAPTAFKDIMGYCQNTWISDYHFSHLATEMQFVSSALDVRLPANAPRKWQVIGVDASGKGTLGVTLDVESLPGGATREVTVVRGGVERVVKGYFHPFGDVAGGLLLVPEDASGEPVTYRLGGRVVARD